MFLMNSTKPGKNNFIGQIATHKDVMKNQNDQKS